MSVCLALGCRAGLILDIVSRRQSGVLGEGSFGKVVMVSTNVEGNDKPMALKIMAKSHIIESDQQIQVMREKQALMVMPIHPFIVELYGTYQVRHAEVAGGSCCIRPSNSSLVVYGRTKTICTCSWS